MKKEDCKHCICLVAFPGDDDWFCDELQKPIKDIEECPEDDK